MQNTKNTNPILNLSDDPRIACLEGWCGASSCRADIRKSWTGVSSRQEMDSGMHELEPGSGSQVGQQIGTFSEGYHEEKKARPM